MESLLLLLRSPHIDLPASESYHVCPPSSFIATISVTVRGLRGYSVRNVNLLLVSKVHKISSVSIAVAVGLRSITWLYFMSEAPHQTKEVPPPA